jgi:hypothetical protein
VLQELLAMQFRPCQHEPELANAEAAFDDLDRVDACSDESARPENEKPRCAGL